MQPGPRVCGYAKDVVAQKGPQIGSQGVTDPWVSVLLPYLTVDVILNAFLRFLRSQFPRL